MADAVPLPFRDLECTAVNLLDILRHFAYTINERRIYQKGLRLEVNDYGGKYSF